jgi:prolyl-tRNA editing enzyme YbaK/EbsC (Cys-tRNA(Pro) deacylase)
VKGIERTILELPRIYINGGKRGYLAGMSPAALVELLGPTPVSVAIDKT